MQTFISPSRSNERLFEKSFSALQNICKLLDEPKNNKQILSAKTVVEAKKQAIKKIS